MSFDALQERLAALQETTGQLRELIDKLANLKYEPGSLPLTTDDDSSAAADLSAEINQVLREEEEDLDLLQEEIIDIRSGRPGSEAEHNKARLKDGASRLEQELRGCRISFRKAQLCARHNLEQAQRLERQLLLASYAASAISSPQNRSGASSPTPKPNGAASPPPQLFTARDRRRAAQQKQRSSSQSRGDAEVAASSDLTEALRRTHDLISSELSRSEFAQQVLHESTAAMKELQQRYGTLDDMLSNSRDLLGTLLKSQKSDTWYLETAMYMLLGTLAWLVFRRFFYGPLWWLVWLPVRTIFRTGKAVSGLAPGQGDTASLVIVQAGSGQTTVVEFADDAIPTIAVDAEKNAYSEGEAESLVDKIGRMVEDTLGSESDADVEGNVDSDVIDDTLKHRQMDEDTPPQAEHVRDEL